MTDPLRAYQLSKWGNSLRVMAEAVRWGKRGARINCISPGIIITPLANDELKGPRGPGYRRMIEASAAGRAGTPDEVANVAALLMGEGGAFITGSDFLAGGGVTAAYWYGELAAKRNARLFPVLVLHSKEKENHPGDQADGRNRRDGDSAHHRIDRHHLQRGDGDDQQHQADGKTLKLVHRQPTPEG